MIGYVTKDEDGEVYLHLERFNDDNYERYFSSINITIITGEFPEFDNINYKDEPIKVEIKLERI